MKFPQISLSLETYLLVATIYYWFLTANALNPIAIILVLIMLYQMTFQRQSTGLMVALIAILLNIYLILSMVIDLRDGTFTLDQYKYIVLYGSLFTGLNLMVGGAMFYKYLKLKPEH